MCPSAFRLKLTRCGGLSAFILPSARSLPPVAGLLLSALCFLPFPAAAQPRSSLDDARSRMVNDEIIGAGITNPRVIQAMRDTPRHEFVRPQDRAQAYYDMSLPIGEKQTISGPFVVAYMTEELDPQPTDRVLEIGTGSGYQAAVLSPLVKEVYSIEIVPELARHAAGTLKRLKYTNVFTKAGDGYQGWAEHAPFDKIIVTCSPENVPEKLIEQLAEGGRILVPVGQRQGMQPEDWDAGLERVRHHVYGLPAEIAHKFDGRVQRR
jgi:protein-L-isoaspartate(D-aspartate) O-methyltransferase